MTEFSPSLSTPSCRPALRARSSRGSARRPSIRAIGKAAASRMNESSASFSRRCSRGRSDSSALLSSSFDAATRRSTFSTSFKASTIRSQLILATRSSRAYPRSKGRRSILLNPPLPPWFPSRKRQHRCRRDRQARSESIVRAGENAGGHEACRFADEVRLLRTLPPAIVTSPAISRPRSRVSHTRTSGPAERAGPTHAPVPSPD